ncbi:hypothetical protein AB6E95_24235, partial [Vibrio splendidus]
TLELQTLTSRPVGSWGGYYVTCSGSVETKKYAEISVQPINIISKRGTINHLKFENAFFG